MSLDDNLRQVILDMLEPLLDNRGLASEGAAKLHIDIATDKIKQIFADEGYRHNLAAGFWTKELEREGMMSGQEFYERFGKELRIKYDQFVDFADIDMNIYNHGKEAMMLAALEAAHNATKVDN